MNARLISLLTVILLFGLLSIPNQLLAQDEDLTFDPGTEEDREALYDFIVESTMEWDAFASLQDHPAHNEHPTGVDIRAELERYRDDLISAETDEEMWFALWKLSNVRMDRHLRVREIDEGLDVPEELKERVQAPIRFRVDYGDLDERFFFVADRGTQIENQVAGSVPELGDRLLAVNGMDVDEFVERITPYMRYSTEDGLWWHIASEITRTREYIPHSEFFDENLEELVLDLEREDGTEYQVTVDYQDPGDVEWQGHGDRDYDGFSIVEEMSEYETYDFYEADNDELEIIILDWYGFRGDLLDAMDDLVEYADEQGILGHHVIVDATRSRGGSNGAYALARLQDESFRTTFGNLKVSPVMERWVEDRLERWAENEPSDSRGQSSVLIHEWLKTDVQNAIDEGRYYTNDVPFKGVQPKWADGIVEPAEKHFTGGLTVWLSPQGGSHLDQFSSQVVDNDVGHTMGMAAGGFSNKWWSAETLRFPTTGKPIVEYEWSMGHSIRPNKEILQYNPTQPKEYIAQTRDNYFTFHEMLLDKTLERLDVQHLAH